MALFNQSFLESGCDIVPVINQGDANADLTGDWIKLRDYSRVTVLLAKYGSEQVDTLGLQFLQATDATGAGSKVLNAGLRYWTKAGTLTAATVWTAGSVTEGDGLGFGSSLPTGFTRVIADATTLPLLLAVDIQAYDLDINNGFDWFTVFIAGGNVDNACLISVWAILCGGRYQGIAPLSAIS